MCINGVESGTDLADDQPIVNNSVKVKKKQHSRITDLEHKFRGSWPMIPRGKTPEEKPSCRDKTIWGKTRMNNIFQLITLQV